MSRLLPLVAFIVLLTACAEDAQHVIRGTVTDFNGQPLDSVTIRLKNKAFENIYETLTDSNGNYAMTVNEGVYYCLYAIKLPEYRVNRLEYWAWNVPVHKDITINPQYEQMEIYGINAFEPQVTPQETYMIYFRPMSLSKSLQLAAEQTLNKKEFETAKQTESLISSADKLINVAPDSISAEELTIEINGEEAKIVGINKMTEYARGFTMYGYNVQVLKPKAKAENSTLKYDRISITLHSKQTDEMGKGEAFIKKN